MDKKRTLTICLEVRDKLDAIINELTKDNPYYGYFCLLYTSDAADEL